MSAPSEPASSNSEQMLRRMSAVSDAVVEKVVRFANDDVPEYLENLRRFEEESRKVRIIVK